MRRQQATRNDESTTRINAKNAKAQRAQRKTLSKKLCVLCASATSAFHSIPGDNHGLYVSVNSVPLWRTEKFLNLRIQEVVKALSPVDAGLYSTINRSILDI